jgi:hypothetical protein
MCPHPHLARERQRGILDSPRSACLSTLPSGMLTVEQINFQLVQRGPGCRPGGRRAR